MQQMLLLELIIGKFVRRVTIIHTIILIFPRKSAAWSNSVDDDFLEFGDSMYSDKSYLQKKVNPSANTVNYGRNRAKITNLKVFAF